MAEKIHILVTCADMRLHNKDGYNVKSDVEELFDLPNTYLITAPGPDHKDRQAAVLDGIRTFSTVKEIETIVLVPHENCAGHPCSPDEHEKDTRVLAQEIQKLLPDADIKAALATIETDTLWGLEEIVL
tara:strand:+ start:3762 stop:4148 length:387 start_codon:yes stop_codon:yes gene_type:complete